MQNIVAARSKMKSAAAMISHIAPASGGADALAGATPPAPPSPSPPPAARQTFFPALMRRCRRAAPSRLWAVHASLVALLTGRMEALGVDAFDPTKFALNVAAVHPHETTPVDEASPQPDNLWVAPGGENLLEAVTERCAAPSRESL